MKSCRASASFTDTTSWNPGFGSRASFGHFGKMTSLNPYMEILNPKPKPFNPCPSGLSCRSYIRRSPTCRSVLCASAPSHRSAFSSHHTFCDKSPGLSSGHVEMQPSRKYISSEAPTTEQTHERTKERTLHGWAKRKTNTHSNNQCLNAQPGGIPR